MRESLHDGDVFAIPLLPLPLLLLLLLLLLLPLPLLLPPPLLLPLPLLLPPLLLLLPASISPNLTVLSAYARCRNARAVIDCRHRPAAALSVVLPLLPPTSYTLGNTNPAHRAIHPLLLLVVEPRVTNHTLMAPCDEPVTNSRAFVWLLPPPGLRLTNRITLGYHVIAVMVLEKVSSRI